jgi:zinc-finger of transposase IS204/IS1001/IS1096/IS1165
MTCLASPPRIASLEIGSPQAVVNLRVAVLEESHESVGMVSLSLVLFPACRDLLIEDITLESKTLILSVRSLKTSVHCPVCASSSAKAHSPYIRTPADLSCLEYAVRLQLQVRRFFCQNGNCPP